MGARLGTARRSAHLTAGSDALAKELAATAQPGDMVVCLGAGNITQWAAALPAELQKLQAGQKARLGGAA